MLPRLAASAALAALVLGLAGLRGHGAGDRLYVADLRSSDVTAVDLARGRAVGRTPVALDPHELVQSGDGSVWVSDYRSALVTRLPGGSGRAVSFPVTGEPHGLARIGNVIAVTQGRAGKVALLDAQTGAVRAEVPTGGEPHIVVAAGGRFYAADAAGGRVLQIDPGAAAVSASVPVGAEPEALAVSPDGATLAIANARSHDLDLIALPAFDGAVRVPMPGAPVRLAYSPDGRTLAVSLNDAGVVALLDTAGVVRARVPVGRLPDGLAFGDDGRSLYVALSGEDRLAVVDPRRGRVTRFIQVGDGPSGLLLVPAT